MTIMKWRISGQGYKHLARFSRFVLSEPAASTMQKINPAGCFNLFHPNLWKRANVLPIHKKESRQLTKNYRPISLLPICGKVFEKIFDEIYTHLQENNLLSPKQSGFRPGDTTINQLLSITNEILMAFDQYHTPETRAVFLDISKAFDKV